MSSPYVPTIVVLAGVNGAGKSSIGGAHLRASGAVYFNPDEVARSYVEAGLTQAQANEKARNLGREGLERAI